MNKIGVLLRMLKKQQNMGEGNDPDFTVYQVNISEPMSISYDQTTPYILV